jgi:two-component system sensor histidine kinase HupT/HoxJ
MGRRPTSKAPEPKVDALHKELGRTKRDLEAARSRLVQQAPLVALGRLVAGVAHELNNPANFIYGGSVALAERLAEWPDEARDESYEELGRLVSVIRTGGERVRDLMECLSSFTRSSGKELSVFGLFAVARSAVALLEPWARRQEVTVEVDGDPEIFVKGRRSELSQVVLNLLTNAIQASEKGTVQVKTERRGGDVCVSVTDDGPGVDEAQMETIFEPFFSTKPEGEGTGLGLAISRSIATSHGGRIELLSGHWGSIFSLVLPALPGREEA